MTHPSDPPMLEVPTLDPPVSDPRAQPARGGLAPQPPEAPLAYGDRAYEEPRPYEDPWSARHVAGRLARPPEPQEPRQGGVPPLAVWSLGVGLALGGALGYMTLRARSQKVASRPDDDAPERTLRNPPRPDGYAVTGRTVTINRPRAELYAKWRDFEGLPSFMENVEAVRPDGERRHVWTISAPGGGSVELRTEITEDREGEVIAWASVEGSAVDTRGHVRFEDAPGGRGTRVEAEIAYKPPAGEIGRLVAKLFQREPSIQGRRELKRFKMLMETGEIATAENRRAA